MKRSIGYTCVAFLFSLSLFAQNTIHFKETTLENGLHLIMHQDNSTPIVAVSVLYHVGSKNEQPDRTGFAHFFEHLLFEGTENIGRGEYMTKIQSIGGTLNAFTSNDITYYYEIVPSNYLETALYMESERMLHPKIDQIGVDTQREVIKEEKRQSYDNRPYGTILPETMRRAFSEHPYRWPVIGSMEDLDAARLEEFIAFHKAYYVPNNATLTIAGDIDYEQAEKWVRMYFGEIPSGPSSFYRPNTKEPKKTEEIRDIVYDNIQIPAIIQAYNLPPKNHPDSFALEMLSTYLTGGNSSLMTKELVDKQQTALAVQAIPLDLEDGGVFIMYALTNMGVDPAVLESEIDRLLTEVREQGVSEQEFQKLQNIIENDLVSKNSSMEGIAQNLAQAHVFYGGADYINQELDKFRAVKREDLQRVANQYINLDGRVVLYYLPKSAQAE
ncbi:Insulinase-like protein [Lunatimonas lonarensis]|uniref:Insulinase-like protein n=1 Tax=Lunatimonas lonarensis TaxID=1232681 RepID=R7ZWU5_9BACT|nr:insulinase family protein [Lunatimonas lonarensis]EON78493.1 Insulinase-like protein [Lunatimonas lonarensis]